MMGEGLRLSVEETLGPELKSQLIAFPDARRFPFLHPEWLGAFEQSQTVLGRSGWIPRHLAVHSGSQLLAFVPAYIKLHSYGEFVFDQSWAQCSELQLGQAYYPKFVVGVPFTPATGPRFLLHPDLSLKAKENMVGMLASALIQLCKELGLSSVHVLFCDEMQASWLREAGFFMRLGVQYQFHNPGLLDFDQFLAGFRAKKRANIRRERREVTQRGYTIEIRSAQRCTAQDARLAYELYLTTVDKYVWGRRYLNQAFFDLAFQNLSECIHFVVAKDASGQVVAGAFNLLGQEAIYGRYWGTFVSEPFLHFDVCLYTGIEETITRRLARFEAGAGGEHKESKGLTATRTRSMHFIVNPRLASLVGDFCEREALEIETMLGAPLDPIDER
jgi:predicted N-acyltransferase